MYVGQRKLINIINEMDVIPHFILLVGAEGCGKSYIVDLLKSKIPDSQVSNYDTLKIDVIREIIDSSSDLTNSVIFYLRKGDTITVQAENALLKLTEEPPRYCYIVLGVTSTDKILPTIQSRATILTFDKYTKDDLKQIATNNELTINHDCIYQVVETPGQLLELSSNFDALYNVAEKLYKNMNVISVGNLFKVTSLLNIGKEQSDKIDPSYFIRTLLCLYFTDSNKYLSYRCMSVLCKALNLLTVKGVNKQMILDDMFVSLKNQYKGDV